MTGDLAVFLLACLDIDEQVEMNAPTATTYERSFRLAGIEAKKKIVEEFARFPRHHTVQWWTIRMLAQPYRGRPGWSDEWETR